MNTNTQAWLAYRALEDRLVKVRSNGNFNSYDHVMVCHACGKLHAVRSMLIASPRFVHFQFSDGTVLALPIHGCSECRRVQGKIRAAWENGTPYEAKKAAAEAIPGAFLPAPPAETEASRG